MIHFHVNGEAVSVPDEQGDMPLLWYLREVLQLTGSKYGCGAGLCGACTVHIDGEAARACIRVLASVAGTKIITIEGLAPSADRLHPVQSAWLAEDVPQCGYCQSGQIMSAAALLTHTPKPSDEDITRHMTNLCRCGIYPRIRRAVQRAASEIKKPRGSETNS